MNSMKRIYTPFKDTFTLYNEKKFEVYYFRGERRTSSKCLIYFHCPTVAKKKPQICGMKR